MLAVYTLNDASKWDEIVKSFKKHDIYYLSGYARGFYLHGDGEPLLFYYEDEKLRAINVVMKRDIAKDDHFKDKLEEGIYFDLATPYGYGGWLLEGDGSKNLLFAEYQSWCRNNSIISEVIRFHPVIGNQEEVRDIYDVMDLGKTVAIPLTNRDDIWNNFSSNNRRHIRKAIKEGVEIHKGFSEELLATFKEVYNITMDRDTATDYYYFKKPFYDSIRDDLEDYCDIYYATYQDKIIAVSLMLRCNGYLSYHLSGSLKEYGILSATSLLLFETAAWGSENGYHSLHLGGGVGSREDSLYTYKKAFYKGDGLQYSIGKMIFDQDKYAELTKMRERIERDNYFPLYRA